METGLEDYFIIKDQKKMRFGYTTGSCAAAAAAYKLGLVESRINVNQPGGMIQIDMEEDGTIYMTGTVGYIADISVAESFFS